MSSRSGASGGALAERPVGAPAGMIRMAGTEWRATAASIHAGRLLLVEIVDHPGAVSRAARILADARSDAPVGATVVHPGGAESDVRFGRMYVRPRRADGHSGLAVTTATVAPIGLLVREERAAARGPAERGGGLRGATAAYSEVIDMSGHPFVMVAGPQARSAAEDETALAFAFAHLAKECCMLPLPPDRGTAVALWRELQRSRRRTPEAAEREDERRQIAVIDMQDEERRAAGADAAIELVGEPGGEMALAPGAGFGLRAWYARGGVGEDIKRFLVERTRADRALEEESGA